jgi:predicted NBD/HSP70 family sugar kinase
LSCHNQASVRTLNRFKILDEIRLSGPVSRVEIAQRTGLSRALVTRITAELISDGLVEERPTTPTKNIGRRRVMLELKKDAAIVAGVKISINQISFALVNFKAQVISSYTLDLTLGGHSVDRWPGIIARGVKSCAQQAGLDMESIAAMGVGLPGFVDWQSGHVHWTPLTSQPLTNLASLLNHHFPFPVYLDNDVNSVTQGELSFGHGCRVENFIVVSIEQGLGMGIVVHNQLYRGTRGIGAEFGHVVLNPDGPPCRCGKRGCVETYAGGRGIMHAANQAAAKGAWPGLDPESLRVNQLIDLAREGDQTARAIFQTAGEMLGLGVSGLIQVFNPDKVILTGEYARADEILFEPMTRALNKYLNRAFVDQDLVINKNWEDVDWARGAACSVLHTIYRDPGFSAADKQNKQ